MKMIDLDSAEAITKYDRRDMLNALARFPDQCRQALELGKIFEVPNEYGDFDKIIASGMGGSGIVGDLLKRFLNLPVFVNKGCHLPKFVNSRTLLIVISYSGNTLETISALEDGLKCGAKIICISSGGKLLEISKFKNIPLISIPSGVQPRLALGYLLLPILKVLSKLGVGTLPEDELEGLPDLLAKLSRELQADIPTKRNPAKQLALRLFKKIPLTYGTEGNTDVVAQRWKTQFNENSKQPAFWNTFPELVHNEIVGLKLQEKLLPSAKVILLRNDYDLNVYKKFIDIMKTILKDRGVGFEEVWASGKSEIGQIFSLVYLGDFVSAYLGILNGVDPTPVEAIEEFKEQLS